MNSFFTITLSIGLAFSEDNHILIKNIISDSHPILNFFFYSSILFFYLFFDTSIYFVYLFIYRIYQL